MRPSSSSTDDDRDQDPPLVTPRDCADPARLLFPPLSPRAPPNAYLSDLPSFNLLCGWLRGKCCSVFSVCSSDSDGLNDTDSGKEALLNERINRSTIFTSES